MKRLLYKIVLVCSGVLLLSACEDYLTLVQDDIQTEEEFFENFISAQGFADVMYSHLVHYNTHALTTNMDIGGECAAIQAWSSADRGIRGTYWLWIESHSEEDIGSLQSVFQSEIDNTEAGFSNSGMWFGWRGIRVANILIRNVEEKDLMKNATQDERDVLLGQAYFLRAWFHFEIIRSWGGMPYVDQVITGSEEMPRLSYVECTEKLVEDLDKAVQLLPEDWDDPNLEVEIDKGIGTNTGRPTKGAAYAVKAKALLYAGSPLMQKFVTPTNPGGAPEFDSELMNRAAEAAFEVMKLADKGVYRLMPFDENYNNMFGRNDGNNLWNDEIIWAKIQDNMGSGLYSGRAQRVYHPGGSVLNKEAFGNTGICQSVTQNYVDKFEMNDGTRYDQSIESNPDVVNTLDIMWNQRDPRFRKAIHVDGDAFGNCAECTWQLWEAKYHSDPDADDEITHKYSGSVLTPYIVRKFIPNGVNKYDKLWNSYTFWNPFIRLPEVYLIYAEALCEANGGNGEGASVSGGPTALEAVNTVRRRANHVDAILSEYTDFRELVRNERAVELCFEGHYWHDKRRWYISHRAEEKPLYDLEFDENYTILNRDQVRTITFENPKHYWMPIPQAQTQLFDSFEQNPGW
ncbi:MAG: RagB/SusD family nutrient uptake outer membrane protein [Bacteroidales bacterium]|nr:RagB/SusD family nutrient uptake outer membrane protein [Bacteroidales bacterium]